MGDDQGNIAGTSAERTAASPTQPGQTQVLPRKGTLGRESKASMWVFQPFRATQEREMGESLLPRSILIGRAQMVPISAEPLNALSVPARRGCCLPPAHIGGRPGGNNALVTLSLSSAEIQEHC